MLKYFECMVAFQQLLEACAGRELLPNWQNTIVLFTMKVINFYRESLNTGDNLSNFLLTFFKTFKLKGNLYLHLVSHHLQDLLETHGTGLTSIGSDQVIERYYSFLLPLFYVQLSPLVQSK